MPELPFNRFFQSVDELPYGRDGVPFDAEGNRNYVRRYRVMVRIEFMSAWSVGRAPLLPRPFAPYLDETATEVDPFCLLVQRRCTQEVDDDWQSWIVTDTYSTKLPSRGQFDAGQPGDQNSPEDEPPDIEWDQEIVHHVPFVDLNGIPYLNSVGLAFTPAPIVNRAFPVLNFSCNQMFFDVLKARSYSFALNSDVFLGVFAGGVQCLPIKAKWTHRGSIPYWRVHYKFRFLPDDIDAPDPQNGPYPRIIGKEVDQNDNQAIHDFNTFQPLILDQGLVELATDWVGKFVFNADGSVDTRPIHGKTGAPINQPKCLDGQGRELKPQRTIANPFVSGPLIPVTDPVYIQFKQFPLKDFASLFQNVRP